VEAAEGGNGTSLPRGTNPLRIKEKARRVTHPGSTHVSYAMDLIESLNVLRRASLPPWSKGKKSKRSGRSPPSGYSTPFEPRWKDNPMGVCMWRPSSMASHSKHC